MREQGKGTREQGTEAVERLLRQALPRIEDDPELDRDLWPAMLRKLDERRKIRVPWFDWVLAGGLAAALAVFPAWIPVLLYYL
jgi:type VI protein secretion system component VasF